MYIIPKLLIAAYVAGFFFLVYLTLEDAKYDRSKDDK
jgi:hypothetical protein